MHKYCLNRLSKANDVRLGKPIIYNYWFGALSQANHVQIVVWPRFLKPTMYDYWFDGDSFKPEMYNYNFGKIS